MMGFGAQGYGAGTAVQQHYAQAQAQAAAAAQAGYSASAYGHQQHQAQAHAQGQAHAQAQAQAGYAAHQQQMQAASQPQAQQQHQQQQYGAQAAQVQGQASFAAAYAAQAAPPQQAAAAPQQDEGVGSSSQIFVSGCAHATVGGIVRGNYVVLWESHGKPAYKKDSQVNGLDVMLYFWDERDGPNFCGWWFGPKVGGDQVWAYHPSRTSMTPPKSGWKVPYDGPADPTFVISARPPQAWNAGAPQGQQQQTQPQGYQQHHQQQQQQQQQHPQVQAQMQAQQLAVQQQNQFEELKRKQQLEDLKRKQQVENLRRLEDMRQKQMDEQRQRDAAANQLRMEQQRQKMEQVQKMQEELRRKQEEERKLREVEMFKKREEQRATLAIRRELQKVKTAKLEGFEDAKKELEACLQKELENSGSQKSIIAAEVDSGVQQAKLRLDQMEEQRKRDEERRVLEEKQRKEAQEKADALVKQLVELLENAEAAAKKLKEEASPLGADSVLELEDMITTAKAVEDSGVKAKEETKKCTEFILMNGKDMKDQGPATEGKPTFASVLQRINECTRATESTITSAREQRTRATTKAAALRKLEQTRALFEKYDADGDKTLSRTEVLKYAKDEYDFTLSPDAVESIFRVLVDEDQKGIAEADFQSLKVAVGVAREKAMDARRRDAREERERKLAQMRAELKEKVDEASGLVDDADALLDKTEEHVQPLSQPTDDASAVDLLDQVVKAEDLIKEGKDAVAAARKQIESLSEGVVDQEIQPWLNVEVQKLDGRTKPFDARITGATFTVARAREDTKKKEILELDRLRAKALTIMRHHQRAKTLKNEELFDELDTNKDGRIEETEFLAFFKSCERPPGNKKGKNNETGTAEGEVKDEDAKKEEVDKEDNEPDHGIGADDGPTPEELAKVFDALDEDDEGYISKEHFLSLIRLYMKVAKDTVLTSDLSIKDSKTLRRLEPEEVIEIIEGPVKEETVDVMRVRALVMKDALDGWITLSGNQGTVFLEEGGNLFKVVKETILTDSFELKEGGESTRKLKDTTRKLKPGEVVEVREWPRKEETSGLMRMQCRTKSDGRVGWATTVGNQGTVFLEVL